MHSTKWQIGDVEVFQVLEVGNVGPAIQAAIAHATTDVSIIQRMGKPEEISNAIVFLLSDEASFITGQILAVDGGFTLK